MVYTLHNHTGLALNSWAFKHSLFILIGGFNDLLIYHFCRPPPLHTPLCSGASGFWSFTVQSLLIIVLQQFKSFFRHVLNRNYNLHTSEARQFSFYWYETFFETWSSLASVPRTSVLWRWLQNSSSISETMKENILISPQPFAIVGCSVAKVKMLVASSVSVVQYRNLHNTHYPQ